MSRFVRLRRAEKLPLHVDPFVYIAADSITDVHEQSGGDPTVTVRATSSGGNFMYLIDGKAADVVAEIDRVLDAQMVTLESVESETRSADSVAWQVEQLVRSVLPADLPKEPAPKANLYNHYLNWVTIEKSYLMALEDAVLATYRAQPLVLPDDFYDLVSQIEINRRARR